MATEKTTCLYRVVLFLKDGTVQHLVETPDLEEAEDRFEATADGLDVADESRLELQRVALNWQTMWSVE
jgi:hypothetical protein